jgi:glycosyltransferase involved in cell wall biosynthesis
VRIGVDGACWTNRRGYGRYTRSLLSALARTGGGQDRYLLFLDPETAQAPDLPTQFEKVLVHTGRAPVRAASASSRRAIADLLRMTWAAARARVDVFFFPSVYTFFPLLGRVRAVATIHDVIAERHPDLVFSRRRFALFWRMKLALAVRQARLIITVSEHARAGIIEQFRLPPERVRIVLEAPDPIFGPIAQPRDPADLLPGCGLRPGDRYLLYVGGLSPHKNLEGLLEAFRRLIATSEFSKLRLLLVGDHTGDVFLSAYERLRAAVTRLHLEGRVCFTGFLPDRQVAELYNRAELLVLPSLDEGFGLPAVEAAACGTPVAASQVGPAESLLGGGVWTFPPRDIDALTEGLTALLRDPVRRTAMGAEGRLRVATLNWDRAAADTLAILREAAR